MTSDQSSSIPLVIFGTGGLARELHQIIEDTNQLQADTFQFVGWLDGNAATHGSLVHGVPVLGGVEWLKGRTDVQVVVGIGAPATRRKIVEQIKAQADVRFANLIHPSVVLGNRVILGEGVTICAGVVGTTDFKVGNHVLVNICATLAHEDDIGDFVTIAPAANISGNVILGEGTDIGTNATLIQGVSVGRWSIIGAGAVVTKDIPDNVTAVGAPAKVIKEREEGWQER